MTDAASSGSLSLEIAPCSQLILENIFPIVLALLHHYEFAMVNISEVLEILHAEMVPFHQEYSGHQAMRDEDTDTGEVLLAKSSP